MRTNSKYYSKKEAAEYLGIDKWVLDQMRSFNRGPSYVRTGSKIRYRKDAIIRWGMRNPRLDELG